MSRKVEQTTDGRTDVVQHLIQPRRVGHVITRDVTDSESDGIRQFFRNPKSDGYLKSDLDGFEILVSVQLKCYFRK